MLQILSLPLEQHFSHTHNYFITVDKNHCILSHYIVKLSLRLSFIKQYTPGINSDVVSHISTRLLATILNKQTRNTVRITSSNLWFRHRLKHGKSRLRLQLIEYGRIYLRYVRNYQNVILLLPTYLNQSVIFRSWESSSFW